MFVMQNKIKNSRSALKKKTTKAWAKVRVSILPARRKSWSITNAHPDQDSNRNEDSYPADPRPL
jgi:hypothetical protein